MEKVIGGHAGKIWSILEKKGTQTPASLVRALGLKAAEVERAIGWLAREEKLSFECKGRGAMKITLK